MVTFAVSEEKNRQLRKMMAEVGLAESDIAERFIRSSGAGGQHVNKTATCVQLIHRPSGIEIKCMKDRSQSVNRFLARRELAERLAAEAGITTAREREQQRIRRQKANRGRKARIKHNSGKAEPVIPETSLDDRE
jgi:protein subunit release factor B